MCSMLCYGSGGGSAPERKLVGGSGVGRRAEVPSRVAARPCGGTGHRSAPVLLMNTAPAPMTLALFGAAVAEEQFLRRGFGRLRW
jgi:hypothetical protein